MEVLEKFDVFIHSLNGGVERLTLTDEEKEDVIQQVTIDEDDAYLCIDDGEGVEYIFRIEHISKIRVHPHVAYKENE